MTNVRAEVRIWLTGTMLAVFRILGASGACVFNILVRQNLFGHCFLLLVVVYGV